MSIDDDNNVHVLYDPSTKQITGMTLFALPGEYRVGDTVVVTEQSQDEMEEVELVVEQVCRIPDAYRIDVTLGRVSERPAYVQ